MKKERENLLSGNKTTKGKNYQERKNRNKI